MRRRRFCQTVMAGIPMLHAGGILKGRTSVSGDDPSQLFWIKGIPDLPFSDSQPNRHRGIDALLELMKQNGLDFYMMPADCEGGSPDGLIAADDVVVIKVNAQWKFRGCTNSDVVRGLLQRILEHPGKFRGEVVIIENGQGRGSLACDTQSSYGSNTEVHANANDESHSFLYLVDEVFKDQPVSAYLLDPIRGNFIGPEDHQTDGYRTLENVSYPCFTTKRGTRIELREGIWDGSTHKQNLKLISVPVLKHHDIGGSEITGALKHMYGVLSMYDGYQMERHYYNLGVTCGKMFALVRPPVLNIIDAIWVSSGSVTGFPGWNTFKANQLLASQDPVALDYWAAKYILYPIDGNYRHHPDFQGVHYWLADAAEIIGRRGGLNRPDLGLRVGNATWDESRMQAFTADASRIDAPLTPCRPSPPWS